MSTTTTAVDEMLEEILAKGRAAETSAPDTESEEDPSKVRQRTPPKRGICRRCKENKPINRLMLCYPCWVKTELEDKSGWREGMPHPSWCECAGIAGHERRSSGN